MQTIIDIFEDLHRKKQVGFGVYADFRFNYEGKFFEGSWYITTGADGVINKVFENLDAVEEWVDSIPERNPILWRKF